MKWPQAVSILTARDIIREEWFEYRAASKQFGVPPSIGCSQPNEKTRELYDKGAIVCCLQGHANIAAMEPGCVRDKIYKAIKEEIVEAVNNQEIAFHGSPIRSDANYIQRFNDDDGVPKTLIAAIWNRAMRRLGYNVPKKYCIPKNLNR